MYLVCDIGNTRAKLALFDGDSLIKQWAEKHLKAADLKQIMEENGVEASLLCSVIDHDIAIERVLDEHSSLVILSHQSPLPIQIDYETPETLGLDRVANAVAANKRFADSDVLVIDIGTCVKFDLVTSGVYRGGSISPGEKMRFKALHTFTAALPLIASAPDPDLVGKSTKGSIQSGAVNGMVHEILGMIDSYSQQYNGLKILITGGGLGLVKPRLESQKNDIFAVASLTLEGLNEILAYNA